MTPGRVFLKKGREGPVRGGNPWVFSQAIDRVEPAAIEPGARVWILDNAGATLGHGYYNPATTIAVRMLALGGEPGPAEIVRWRLERALKLRAWVIGPGTDCCRMLNGDGDGLSGVVVDRYGETAVVQLLTAGAARMREEIVGHLNLMISPRAIFERSQGAVRRQEGLEDRVGVLYGAPADEVVVSENGVRMLASLEYGQKTGLFLDQRENRARFGALATGARVLDLCCYAGGFALNALKGGAKETVALDTSERALGWARRNLELNGYPPDAIRFVHGEAGEFLGKRDERFDLIVLDPPPFARSRADARRAEHLYVELNALALGALNPGGFLMTFSCSSHFCGEDFVRAVRIAEGRSGRRMRLLARLGPGPDHPVLLGHPEGEYLTGVLLRDLG
ncbi:MAG TPA: class I SAM-dependent rRNA methyltransferase [Candidatus Binataceae bacterium]|jgi:23S rRNA (cytosine1962-C5)-methyltransferase|nr:class I SAM-dependent rRNA methyltransferase [Candidatus Binataceae bacterium]